MVMVPVVAVGDGGGGGDGDGEYIGIHRPSSLLLPKAGMKAVCNRRSLLALLTDAALNAVGESIGRFVNGHGFTV